jgi:hypothetical protein
LVQYTGLSQEKSSILDFDPPPSAGCRDVFPDRASGINSAAARFWQLLTHTYPKVSKR